MQRTIYSRIFILLHEGDVNSSYKDIVMGEQQANCNTTNFRSGINHMLILKNSKDLLQSGSFSELSALQTFDFSSLYTMLPHDKLNSRLKRLISKSLAVSKNYVVLGYKSTYFFFLKYRKRAKCATQITRVKYASFHHRLHICHIWRSYFSTTSLRSNRHLLCSSPCRFLFISYETEFCRNE